MSGLSVLASNRRIGKMVLDCVSWGGICDICNLRSERWGRLDGQCIVDCCVAVRPTGPAAPGKAEKCVLVSGAGFYMQTSRFWPQGRWWQFWRVS